MPISPRGSRFIPCSSNNLSNIILPNSKVPNPSQHSPPTQPSPGQPHIIQLLLLNRYISLIRIRLCNPQQLLDLNSTNFPAPLPSSISEAHRGSINLSYTT
ncbi:hypothetical protein L484_011256 [Morus notabilis]|uniref:Uncharacterized protein n=1 Tax=Morus notabilis TaxID=981085 RepID=W9RUM4_9ROSA|nr:hypothetical protein L484_011256 [Morus notabilis]